MPQAPEFIRQRWHYDEAEPGDSKAISHLRPNFKNEGGVIVRRDAAYEPTAKDYDAIAYLVLEWDYDYDPKRISLRNDSVA